MESNNQTLLISIIIPCYNTAATIERCIESVKNQNFADWELLLVDDGSSDNTLDKCRQIAEKDGRIVVLQQSHQGVSTARNLALSKAHGKYVCFIDSDDWIESDYLETLYAHCDYDLTVCGYFVDKYVWNKGKKLGSESHIPQSVNFKDLSDKTALACIFKSGIMHMNWNKMFHRETIERHHIRYQCYPVNEDYLFILEYMKHVQSVCVIDKPLYHWIRYEGRLSGVDSIPDNIVEIYNKSHLETRNLFNNDYIADEILYYSYNMLIWKYLRFAESGVVSLQEALRFLKALHKNELCKASYSSYKPNNKIECVLYLTEKKGWFRLRYCMHRLISRWKN